MYQVQYRLIDASPEDEAWLDGPLYVRSIVDRVRPSVEGLLRTELKHDMHSLVGQAVRSNVRTSVDHLRHGSALLEQLIRQEGLLVVGAEYSLETGIVEFFDGV